MHMLFRNALLGMALGAAVIGAHAAEQRAQDAAREQDIAAWIAFTEELKAAGVRFLQENRQDSELATAEGPLYVAQHLSAAVTGVLARQDASLPLLRLTMSNLNKWGMDSADAKYLGASLDSGGSYRLSGTLGSARIVALQLVRNARDFEAFASLSGAELGADAEGRFAVAISRERPADWQGPWLPLPERANSLLVREYFADWNREMPSRFVLERLDPPPQRAPLTVADSANTLQEIAGHFDERLQTWVPAIKRAQGRTVNKLYPALTQAQGLKNNIYGDGWFRLTPEQALVIELDKPEAELWSVQLGNPWWQSVDYVNATGSLNSAQAVASSDGRYRLVVSLKDPGVPNWLDPAGHGYGTLMYRFQNAKFATAPRMRLVAFDKLGAILPRDTPDVAPEQREAEYRMRRAHVMQRWAP